MLVYYLVLVTPLPVTGLPCVTRHQAMHLKWSSGVCHFDLLCSDGRFRFFFVTRLFCPGLTCALLFHHVSEIEGPQKGRMLYDSQARRHRRLEPPEENVLFAIYFFRPI